MFSCYLQNSWRLLLCFVFCICVCFADTVSRVANWQSANGLLYDETVTLKAQLLGNILLMFSFFDVIFANFVYLVFFVLFLTLFCFACDRCSIKTQGTDKKV